MTLIGIATYGQKAEIITDTSCYTPNIRTLSRSSKVDAIQHLDAAVITQGALTFTVLFKLRADYLAGEMADFDHYLRRAREEMRQTWQQALSAAGRATLCDSTVFLVGYSPTRGRFVAYSYASEHDFKPVEIKGLFVHPSPTHIRPSDLELDRFEASGHVRPGDLETLRGRPHPKRPATVEDWIALAINARQHRACAHINTGLKTLVTGQVFHTRLFRGAVTSEVVWEFDDSGEEFQTIVAGTCHPQGQLGPCPCGSGERYLDCHLAKHTDQSCGCGSGRLFKDCCRLDTTVLGAPAVVHS